jgi:hypothetical protein
MYWQRNMFPSLGIRLCTSSTTTSSTDCDAERVIANGDTRRDFCEGKLHQQSENVAAGQLPNYRQYSYPRLTRNDVFPAFQIYYLQSSDHATLSL